MQLAAFHVLSVASETSSTSQGNDPEEVEEVTETERPELFAACNSDVSLNAGFLLSWDLGLCL